MLRGNGEALAPPLDDNAPSPVIIIIHKTCATLVGIIFDIFEIRRTCLPTCCYLNGTEGNSAISMDDEPEHEERLEVVQS